jgi:hypothetical protein
MKYTDAGVLFNITVIFLKKPDSGFVPDFNLLKTFRLFIILLKI